MNELFSQYVTSQAFNLSLSKNHCWLLRQIGAKSAQGLGYSHFVPTVNGLIRRGLVYHDYISPRDNPPKNHQQFKLTEAGKIVFKLVKMSGVGEELPLHGNFERLKAANNA